MSADIFISFASQDAKTARTICTALEGRGFRCWISTRDIQPGENFQSAIVRAIRNAKVLLLVFTSNSNRSDEMTKELALASQQKLMVVPLRVENVDPSDAFAYEFATRQWIDLFADWEQAMNHLCARLSAALDDDRTHTDTIVLGKPSLTDKAAAQALVSRKRRMMMIGAAAVVLLGVVVGLLLAPGGEKSAPVSAGGGGPVPAAMAAPVPAATPAVAPVASQAPAATPVPPAAPEVPKPADAPKPRPAKKNNLPY
jgi:TIR domain